jgi:hypothetical protein
LRGYAGLLGVWLGSVWIGRPAPMLIMRGFTLAKVGPEGLRAWEAKWETNHQFRQSRRLLTFVWGCASVLNVVVTLAAAYLLPLDLAPAVLNASWPVIVVPTAIFHLYYTKKANLRA